MADTSNLSNYLKDVADAIRAKKETTEQIPAANFDTEILSISVGEDLTDVLQEQTEIITELQEVLKNKTKTPALPNIFISPDEPSSKEGIWLQTSDKTYNKIITDYNVLEGATWQKEDNYPLLPVGFTSCDGELIGNEFYLFGGTNAYKINLDTFEFSKLADIPFNFTEGFTALFKNNIYLFYSPDNPKVIYKYNVSTNTYEQLDDFTEDMPRGDAYGNDELGYIFLNYYSGFYKYNPDTGEKIRISGPTWDGGTALTAMGDYLYVLGSYVNNGKYACRYNMRTGENSNFDGTIPNAIRGGNAMTVGTDIYLIGNTGTYYSDYSDLLLKYDTITSKWSSLSDRRPKGMCNSASCVYKNQLYTFGGAKDADGIYVFSTESSTYDDDAVIIYCAKNNFGNYNTQLFQADNIDGRLLYSFYDVYYYSLESGLDRSIPTYYGDGEKWVKFKN